MRPLRLTVDGFRSYASSHTFEFAGRRLVGIVGPIGSGKSSLLDAIAFALYGRTPRVSRDTRGLINQRRPVGRVELWFDVDGDTWRVVRALRREGQSEHNLYRHESPDPGSARLDEVLGARQVTARVEELIGLDFAAFGRSVLLAQNQFAAFLEATPGERDKVLQGAFGFDRLLAMHEVAKGKRDATGRDLEELERRRREIESDREALDQARGLLQTAAARVGEFRGAEPALTAAARELAALDAARAEAGRRSQVVEAALAALPADLEEQLAGAEKAATALREAEEARTTARAAAAAAAAALEELVAAIGDRAAVAGLRHRVERLAELQAAAVAAARRAAEAGEAEAAAGEAAAKAQEDAERATGQREEAERSREAARAARVAAAGRLDEVRHDHMAAALRTGLAAGDPCPVCLRPLDDPPPGRAPADLSAAERELHAATTAESRAEQAAAAAAKAAAGADRALATAGERHAGARERVAALTADAAAAAASAGELAAALHADLGDGDPAELVADLARRLDEAERLARERREVAAAADERCEAARAAVAAEAETAGRLAGALVTARTRLDVDVAVGAEPPVLIAAERALREAGTAQVARLRTEIEEREAAAAELGERRAALLAGLGLDPGADFTAELLAVEAAHAEVKGTIGVLEQRVARFAELERENERALARLAVLRRLADDLAPSRFLNYLLVEERVRLADLGSARFETLSGGRYRFDRAFDVIDLTSAEQTRSADSLSGGETFLASLALALALADMVAREGGRLDAFFLDEGFGSLDADHLDLAMEGVERLAADGADRLVAVVSHVTELRQRLEDLIVLDKDPLTGDTIVVGA